MPRSTAPSNHAQGRWSARSEGSRPTRPCRVCQVQLGAWWIYVVHCMAAIWLDRTTKNKAYYGALSVATIATFYMLSDEPYHCGEGHQRGPGRHLWGRQATAVMQVGRRLGAWFRERFAFPQRSDREQEPEADGVYDRRDVEWEWLGTALNLRQVRKVRSGQDFKEILLAYESGHSYGSFHSVSYLGGKQWRDYFWFPSITIFRQSAKITIF